MRNFYLNILIILLLSFSFVFANCNDGIDNDGDDTIDTDDVGCLDSTDASERNYGYQIQIDSDADESCVEILIQSDESCFEDHYDSFAWLFAFMVPEMFSSCLDDYSSNYFGLTYDSSLSYTHIAVADCVHDHKDDYLGLVLSEYDYLDDSQKETAEEMCYQVYYDEYYLNCETSITTETGCSGGLDDDSDDLIDCADPDCAGIGGCDYQYETCDDDFDNDGDGLEDCDDDGCSGDEACATSGCLTDEYCISSLGTAYACDTASGSCVACTESDGESDYLTQGTVTGINIDGEIYGTVSDYCVDDDTVYEYFCMNTGYYDTDGEVDCGEGFGCADGACYLIEVAPEGDSSESVCVDSDCGNYVCNPDDKPNCYSQCGSNIECSSGYVCDSGNCVEDISESVIVEVCYDGLDEDEDGLVDCTDDDCFSDSLCLESGNCADGYDNDLDGLEDCADDDCSGDEACVSLSGPSYAAGIEESFLTKFLSWLVFW